MQTSERKSSKINFVDEGSETKGRAPPESQADAKKKPNPRKLKSDAQKAKERAEQLRLSQRAGRTAPVWKSGNFCG